MREESDKERLLDLYQQGQSPSAIAERLGCSLQTVRDHLKMFSTASNRKYSAKDLSQDILYYHTQGLSSQDISQKVGRSYGSVKKLLCSMGLKDNAFIEKEKKLQDLRDRICLLHSQGVSSKEIAKQVGRSYDGVCKFLRSVGLKGNPSAQKERERQNLRNRICLLHSQGLSTQDIANTTQRSLRNIRDTLYSMGLKGKTSIQRKKESQNLQDRVLLLHSQGLPSKDIAEKVGRSHGNVCKLLRSEGLKGHPPPPKKKKRPDLWDQIALLHSQGLSGRDIAKKVERSPQRVGYILHSMGLKGTTPAQKKKDRRDLQKRISLLHSRGLSSKDIAQQVGRSYDNVRKLLRSMGLKSNAPLQREKKRQDLCDQITLLHSQGLPSKEIAMHVDRSVLIVNKILRLLGLKSNGRRKVNKRAKESILEMYKKGETLENIAKVNGFSAMAVYKVIYSNKFK